MKLLVVGSGGREHAIAKKLLESRDVEQVFVAPGNDGMRLDGLDLINIGISEHSKLIDFAKVNDIAWTRSEERRVGKECLRLCRSRWSPYH